jgi:hypothetical protein
VTVGEGEGVVVGVGIETPRLLTWMVVAKVRSPIAPEANVASVVVKTRLLFTYKVIVLP